MTLFLSSNQLPLSQHSQTTGPVLVDCDLLQCNCGTRDLRDLPDLGKHDLRTCDLYHPKGLRNQTLPRSSLPCFLFDLFHTVQGHQATAKELRVEHLYEKDDAPACAGYVLTVAVAQLGVMNDTRAFMILNAKKNGRFL